MVLYAESDARYTSFYAVHTVRQIYHPTSLKQKGAPSLGLLIFVKRYLSRVKFSEINTEQTQNPFFGLHQPFSGNLSLEQTQTENDFSKTTAFTRVQAAIE